MLDFRPILLITGMLLVTLAGAMLIPVIADILFGTQNWKPFLGSSLFTASVGISLILSNRSGKITLDIRQMFVLTTLSWTSVAAFGGIPFVFADLGMSYTDAFFESMSGITTTGSTVLSSLDSAPKGILIWRALLQWLGGIGIILMAVAILPLLQVGGMQLFKMESSINQEKTFPRTAQIATSITLIYFALTLICAISLRAAGMNGFDSIIHSMTTIATGGFSSHDKSIGYFESNSIQLIIIIGMLFGSLPFLLYLEVAKGRVSSLFRDSQVRTFFGIVLTGIVFITLWRSLMNNINFSDALLETAFNSISVITGTGYSTTNYSLWGGFAVACLFIFMFIGGCAGSTSCGIKIFRFEVLFSTAKSQINKLRHPHGVFIPQYNNSPLPDSVIEAVMNFLFLFAFIYIIITLALASLGLDFITSISSAATAIANVGPALGDIAGPSGNFSSFPTPAKWILSLGMLLGRLELFTVLVLFLPRFWRG